MHHAYPEDLGEGKRLCGHMDLVCSSLAGQYREDRDQVLEYWRSVDMRKAVEAAAVQVREWKGSMLPASAPACRDEAGTYRGDLWHLED